MISPNPECELCPLCEKRYQLVLPDGDMKSTVVLVGEAPGENEDKQGRPFVGKSGKILTDMLESVGISRSEIMITNTVKCRPPNNRDPTIEEINMCKQFLISELKNRKLVVGLGKSACKSILGFEGKMSEIANVVVKVDIEGTEINFLPTYHPAATIYNKESRAKLKEAMEMVARYLK